MKAKPSRRRLDDKIDKICYSLYFLLKNRKFRRFYLIEKSK